MGEPIDCVCLHLRKAARAASRAYDKALAPHGLRSTQFSLLCMIRARRSVAVTDLAEMAVMERTTLTRNLRVLEGLGLVTTTPGEDRRKRLICLTPAGAERIEEALPAWREIHGRMVGSLGTTRARRLRRDLTFTAHLDL